MTTLWQDILYGCRMLLSRPGFTIAAVLSLALGIGANATIFSVINGTLLASQPFRDPDHVGIIWMTRQSQPGDRGSVAAANYLDWKAQAKSFSDLGASYENAANLGAQENGTPAETLVRQQFTPSMWRVLDVKPMLGRVYGEDEDQPGNPAPVAVLSYNFWQRQFGGKADAIGKTMPIDGEKITVIGVMPKGFRFGDDGIAYWSPVGFSPQQLSSAATFLIVAARLKEGVKFEQASAELESLMVGLRQARPEQNRERSARAESIQRAFSAGYDEPLFVLQGAVAFVLLIACANVAGLLLARASARRTEVAVRSSLGASRGRIVRQMLTESVLLAIAGGVLGVGLSWVGLRLIQAALPVGDLPPDISIDYRVMAFTAAISIITGLLFGLVPALQTSKVNLSTALKESGRTGMEGMGRQRLRSILVAAQIGLALVLLIGAGLMMSSFLKLQSQKLGLDPKNVLTFEFRFGQQQMMKAVGRFRNVGLWEIYPTTGLTFERLYERVRTIPGVISAAGVSRPPASGGWMSLPFQIAGQPRVDPDTPGGTNRNAVYFAITPNFFATMKIPLINGRDVDDRDTAAAPPVIIVNKAFADRYLAGQNPLGQRLALDFVPDEPFREVIGVVGNTLTSSFERDPQPTVYVPHLQQAPRWQGPAWNYRAAMAFVLRTSGDPQALVPAVRTAVAEIDSSKPAGNLRTMETYLREQTSEIGVFMMLLVTFGAAAALLAAVGIYGVMAYAVAQRTREIGIRMALGASGTTVMGLVVRQALLLIAVGVILGIAGAYGLTRFLTNFLWNVSPTDPVTFALVAAGLIGVGVLACFVPTRRAVQVDPTVALRYE
jgi:putative ABC transport system permease protein